MTSRLTLACCAAILTFPLAAQTTAQDIAAGDSLYAALQPEPALARYQAALAREPGNYDALWKAARSAVDVAKRIPGDNDYSKAVRDSVYEIARAYSTAATKADSTGADGHFMLSQTLGRLSRTRGGKERVRFARIIYDEAALAVRLDSTHDGAHHVLGAWHAEVRRLSGVTRFFAKTLFGAGFMDIASWDSATVHLERAVAIRPSHIYHRLELALVYIDRKQYSRARENLTTIASLPIADVSDPEYQKEAVDLLKKIANRKEKL